MRVLASAMLARRLSRDEVLMIETSDRYPFEALYTFHSFVVQQFTCLEAIGGYHGSM